MSDESPLDRFKSVLTGTARAIAREPELEIAWTADAPIANGKNLRVPMPGRTLPLAQAMEARGFADSMALKLRHHQETLHARHAPSEPTARAAYDAVEQVRFEALGSKAYAGMRGNLDAANAVRLGGDPITRATRPDEVPVPMALSLLLREHLTGQPVPEVAEAGVAMLRSWIEERAAADFDALALLLDDQKAFQSLTLDMLQHLELTQAARLSRRPTRARMRTARIRTTKTPMTANRPKISHPARSLPSRAKATKTAKAKPSGRPMMTAARPRKATRARRACCRSVPTVRGPSCHRSSITSPIPKPSTKW